MSHTDKDADMVDEWPKMPDGCVYDGEKLLQLVESGNSPFSKDWDVKLLIQEVEQYLNADVIDIPTVECGSNFYVGLFRSLNFSSSED